MCDAKTEKKDRYIIAVRMQEYRQRGDIFIRDQKREYSQTDIARNHISSVTVTGCYVYDV